MVLISLNMLPSFWDEITFLFDKIHHGYEEILNNLFFIKIELEAGEIPVFTPDPPLNFISTNSSLFYFINFLIQINQLSVQV